MTGDLAVWLRAQLDADEQTARAGEAIGVESYGSLHIDTFGARDDDPVAAAYWDRFDPAFTLADITAKRAIIDDLAVTARAVGEAASPEEVRESATAEWYLRLLAQPYAGRPGWREGWKIDLAPPRHAGDAAT